jgi:hypothetical protein
METTPSPISLPRTARQSISQAALRQLIKSTLGYNARQVTVATKSSIRYLKITIRDAAVDLAGSENAINRLALQMSRVGA